MAGISRIVVGVDGSDSSRKAFRWAYDEAAHHGASITAVSTWHPPALPMTPPYGSVPPEGYVSQPKQDALDLLERFVADLDVREPAVDVRTSVEEGNPAKVLIERSNEADLSCSGLAVMGGSRGCCWARSASIWSPMRSARSSSCAERIRCQVGVRSLRGHVGEGSPTWPWQLDIMPRDRSSGQNGTVLDMGDSCVPCTIRTSQVALRTTSAGTEPRLSPSRAPRPRLPTTMRLAGSLPATSSRA